MVGQMAKVRFVRGSEGASRAVRAVQARVAIQARLA